MIDYDDEAVRGALVLEEGQMRWPAPPPAKAATTPPPPPAKKAAEVAGPKDLYQETLNSALTTTAAVTATLAIGSVSSGGRRVASARAVSPVLFEPCLWCLGTHA